jgi:apolipoprotein N-acyltransferase
MISRLTGAGSSVWWWRSAVFVAGALSVTGFAPLDWFPLPLVGAAILFWRVSLASCPRHAALLGFAFGLGFFVFGVGWIYIALHEFGGMPAWLTAPLMLLFCSYLAIFPAAACAVTAAAPLRRRWWVFAGAWVSGEWLRGWLFTGFPWLALGYSQVPSSPLAALAPVAGVFGVSLALTLLATAAVSVCCGSWSRSVLATAGGIALACLISGRIEWSTGEARALPVTLVQGNVAQDLKFREDRLLHTLAGYRAAVEQAATPLVILPETALPLFLHEIPPAYLGALQDAARRRGGDVIAGVFQNDPVGSDRYFNAVISLGQAPSQGYRKHHLVPFGEFIPFKAVLAPVLNDWLHIPLSDQTRGEARQRPLAVAGALVAMNICYEDVFGDEIVRQLPEATILANVSNDAWYGRSWAAEQHLQISQMRALESGRWMLRATNTGVTAIIDHEGRVRARLPQFVADQLSGTAQTRTGTTPFARAGNIPAAALAGLMVLTGVGWRRRGAST